MHARRLSARRASTTSRLHHRRGPSWCEPHTGVLTSTSACRAQRRGRPATGQVSAAAPGRSSAAERHASPSVREFLPCPSLWGGVPASIPPHIREGTSVARASCSATRVVPRNGSRARRAESQSRSHRMPIKSLASSLVLAIALVGCGSAPTPDPASGLDGSTDPLTSTAEQPAPGGAPAPAADPAPATPATPAPTDGAAPAGAAPGGAPAPAGSAPAPGGAPPAPAP
jgi:hypothetical protein